MMDYWKNEGQGKQVEIQLLKCIWMMSGTVSFKLCDREYDCEDCAFYQAWLETKENSCKIGETDSHRHHPGHKGTVYSVTPGNQEYIGDIFLHPAHVWARVEEQGRVRIGLDDFAQRLLGRIYSVGLPAAETQVSNGNACWRIAHSAGETEVPIPLNGTVDKSNEKLMVSPSLINQDPYGEGWALYMRPDNLESSLKKYHYGEQAKAWSAKEYSRLNHELSKLTEHPGVNLGTTLPDGGRPFENFIALLSPEQQRKIIALFLKGGL